MPRVSGQTSANLGHFAINVDDMNRAQRFYQRVFGWAFEAWGPPGFYQISTGTKDRPGIRGAMQLRRDLIEGIRTVGFECTFGVDDVDAVADAVVANGGTILIPKVMIPGVGHLIFFRDPEGNAAGAMQYDPKAADRV